MGLARLQVPWSPASCSSRWAALHGSGPARGSYSSFRGDEPSSDRHAGEAEQVRDRELAVFPRAELAGLRVPVRLHAQEGERVASQQPDEDLRDDSAVDRSEPLPLAQDLRLLQDVEEQGHVLPEDADEVLRQGLQVSRMQDQFLWEPDRTGDRLPGRQAERLSPPQVAFGERMDSPRDRLGQDAEPERELRVDLAARLDLEAAALELEEPRPLDHVSRRKHPEAPQVLRRRLREDRDILHLGVQLVLPADNAVPEPVGADGELDGHERTSPPVKELQNRRERLDRLRPTACRHLERDRPQDVVDHVVPDEAREEVVDDGPLVMPADDPPSLIEPPFRWQLEDGRPLDDLVVIPEDAKGELRDDQVLIVPGVPEERSALRVPREVVLARLIRPNQHADAVVLIQERLVVRAPPVDGVEVKSRRAEVDERVRVVVPLQLRRRVERQVVVDELPEVREARGDVRVVARGDVLAFLRLGFDHRPGERVERVVRREECREVREHPPESALEGGGSQDRAEAAGFLAMKRVVRHGSAPDGPTPRTRLNALSPAAPE